MKNKRTVQLTNLPLAFHSDSLIVPTPPPGHEFEVENEDYMDEEEPSKPSTSIMTLHLR